MPVLVCLLGIVVGLVIGWFIAIRRSARTGDPIRKHPPGMEEQLPYRLSPGLLTASENACYRTLLSILPEDQTLLAKVRLADLLQVTYGAGDRSIAHGRIANKVVDFLICNRELAPLAVVQLEGSHPDRAETQSRQFLRGICDKVRLQLVAVSIKSDYAATEFQALQTSLGGSTRVEIKRSPAPQNIPAERERFAY